MQKYLVICLAALIVVSCKKEKYQTILNDTKAIFTMTNPAGDCFAPQVQGKYYAGSGLTTTNKIVIRVDVSRTGVYSLSTDTLNGYSFSASGSFTATGIQFVVLQGNGIPIALSNNTFSINGTTGCGFSIKVVDANQDYDDNDNMYFGNPGNADPSADNFTNYLMRNPYYALSYNRDHGIPNWVSWHLYANDLGGVSRLDDFRADSSLPAGWYMVPETAYDFSGFDRGHNTPSADRTNTAQANSATFLMTNMIPQAPNHNRGVWATMEDSLRQLVNKGFEIYIIMGVYGVGGTGDNGYKTTIDAGRVQVPANIWKVALVLPNGDNDIDRVGTNTRLIAVDIQNTNSLPSSNWKNYRVTVDAIEAATGLDLLSRLSNSLQTELESKADKL